MVTLMPEPENVPRHLPPGSTRELRPTTTTGRSATALSACADLALIVSRRFGTCSLRSETSRSFTASLHAEVLYRDGRFHEAVNRALELYEQKGNVVSARKARTLLNALRETASA
jgi:hypothetical protein